MSAEAITQVSRAGIQALMMFAAAIASSGIASTQSHQ